MVGDILERAGKLLLSYWPPSGEKRELKISEKGDKSLVTEADLRCSELLTTELGRLPEEGPLPVVSEESEGAQDHESFWLIDPLDGTSDFVNGGVFAILVARIEEGRVKEGWVSYPSLGEMYSPHETVSLSSLATARPGRICTRLERFKAPAYEHPERISTQTAFRQLFQGELDGLVLEMGRLGPWDVAGPEAIICAAGGKVTDQDGKAVSYHGMKCSAEVVVLSNGHCHEALLEGLR